MREKGIFIVIDGLDGSGKTTQVELLSKRLIEAGADIELFDFPQYGKKSAGPIEEYLSGKYGSASPEICYFFYAVDRFDSSFKIKKSLKHYKIAISNRYVTSNAAHQGGKIENDEESREYFKWLGNLEYEIFKIPKPSLNIILHLDPETSFRLAGEKYTQKARPIIHGNERDLHEKDFQHFVKAERVYLQIAKEFQNTSVIECMEEGKLLSPQEVHEKVWQMVNKLI